MLTLNGLHRAPQRNVTALIQVHEDQRQVRYTDMSAATNQTLELPTPKAVAGDDPATLCGDRPLTAAQRSAYLDYHAQRNLENAVASKADGVATRRLPPCTFPAPRHSSPSRACVNAFLRMAAHRIRAKNGRREICMLDLGCGSGKAAGIFEAAGFTGRYIGLDLKRHKRWIDHPNAALSRELILSDVFALDLDAMPRLDIIISATSLEHIEDDRLAVERIRTRLAHDGAEAHIVPAEGSLPLYGAHGWRQYSPRCLRRLFPTGEIFRMAGPVSAHLHDRVIIASHTRGEASVWTKLPKPVYAAARTCCLQIDRLIVGDYPNRPPTMYGVLCAPGAARGSRE